MENWKDIKGYEGKYQVSDLGRVKSLKRWVNHPSNGGYFIKEKILKAQNGGNNYLIVGLSKDMKSKSYAVHKLVAEAFLGKKENRLSQETLSIFIKLFIQLIPSSMVNCSSSSIKTFIVFFFLVISAYLSIKS